jgi:ribonuclease D
MSIKDDDLPSYPRRGRYRRKDSLVLERIKELRQMREKLSRSMGMEPGFLLNNTMIDTLAFKNPATIDQLGSIDNIRHWQVESMGACILATLGRCRA